MKRAATALALVLLAACGGADKPAEPARAQDPAATEPAGPPAPGGEVDPEWKRMGDMALDLVRKLHAVATSNAENCDAMADGLVKMVDDNKAFIDETSQFQGSAEFNAWFGETYQTQVVELMREIQPALMGCQDNEKLMKALEQFKS